MSFNKRERDWRVQINYNLSNVKKGSLTKGGKIIANNIAGSSFVIQSQKAGSRATYKLYSQPNARGVILARLTAAVPTGYGY